MPDDPFDPHSLYGLRAVIVQPLKATFQTISVSSPLAKQRTDREKRTNDLAPPLGASFNAFPGAPVPPLLLVLHLIGLFVARWLFFAEAEHVVGSYYGKR